MKETRLMMNMPITVELAGKTDGVAGKDIEKIFGYFNYIEEKFNVFKPESEISKINSGALKESDWSEDMKTVFRLSEETKKDTDGYFDIVDKGGKLNPSGLVKGWAIWNAGKMLAKLGYKNYFVDAGGDIQTAGKNEAGEKWKIGIRNPFNKNQIVKTVELSGEGIATSGNYERGNHIYNPHNKDEIISDVASITVIGKNIYEADRFATPAFAMGKAGINFIEKISGLEGYMIGENGVATMTSGFEKFLK